ncbi:MAG: exo-alpha-sialidase [Pirellulales bacterium]|nr:exo-alpha-sialidase [Pirellulales bacterium]
MRRGPRIAASGDSIVISAIGSSGADEEGNIYTWRSQNQGDSWQGPLRVNDVDASAREGLHGMAAGPGNELYCAWLDLRGNGTQIFGSRSADGGATWSANVLIYESPDGTVCECCHPSVAMDESGGVYVMWRNFLDGNRDMFLATSRDRGESFEPAVKLGEGSWALDACPMDGGAIAVAADGRLRSVWRRDQEVLLTDGGLFRETRLGVGMQPWATADRRGLYAVWLSSHTGRLYLAQSSNGEPVELADHAQYPVVAASPTGKGPVVVAWESERESGPQIKAQRIDRE